jgi:hypothetical protein
MEDRKVWRRQRQAPRAEVKFSVQVHGTFQVLEANTLDLSRSGLRLKFCLADLGLKPNAGLFDVAREVNRFLGESCIVCLRRPGGAETLSKHVRVVRLGTMRRTVHEIDIGCRFIAPLSDADLAVLGLTSASRGESEKRSSSESRRVG